MTKFVKLDESLLESEAWAFLKPGSRALYVELKRQFNGSNNGKIFLSYRDAAARLGVHRNSVGGYFGAIESVGLIEKTGESKIGPSGIGSAATWRLSELPDGPEEKPEKVSLAKEVRKKPEPPKFVRPIQHEDDDAVLDDEVSF